MRKWGVRIIGIFFLLWSFFDLLELVTGNHHGNGFMGIEIHLFGASPDSFDIMAFIGVYITAYIGYHLLKFDPQGRKWALIVLWPATILAGLYLLLALVASVVSLRPGTGVSPTLSHLKFSLLNLELSAEIEGFRVVLVLGLFFLFYLLPTWFLMRKDIKSLFPKSDAPLEQAS